MLCPDWISRTLSPSKALLGGALGLATLLVSPEQAHAQADYFYLDRAQISGAPDDGFTVWRPTPYGETRFYGFFALGYAHNTLRDETVTIKPFWIASTETPWEAYDVFTASGPPSPPYGQEISLDALSLPSKSYILPDLPRLERLYPHFCIVQVNNVFNMPQKLGDKRWVADPHPQIVFQYYDGRTGELDYAEAISVDR